MTWTPTGYPSVSPYLIVRDAKLIFQFLRDVFGAPWLRLYPRDDGKGVTHAESPFAKAAAAGGKVVKVLRRSGHGAYRGSIAKGNGTAWWISAHEDDPE